MPATMLWHPVGIKEGGKNVTPFDSEELGRTQFIVCGSDCDDILHSGPLCSKCGVLDKTEITWSEETHADPNWVARIPLRPFLGLADKFCKKNVKPEGLTPVEDKDWESQALAEWRTIQESPVTKEAFAYLSAPAPQVRDALCQKCGTHVFLLSLRDGVPRLLAL